MARQPREAKADRENRSRILDLLRSATAAARSGDRTAAESAFTDAVVLARTSGLGFEQVFCLQQLGQYRVRVGAAAGARAAYEEGLERCCELGSSDALPLAANLLAGLGELDLRENDAEAAFAHLAVSLALLQLDDRSAWELALRIARQLHGTLTTAPDAANRAARRASDLYLRLLRASSKDRMRRKRGSRDRLRSSAPPAFTDTLAMTLSELVGRAGMMHRRDDVVLCLAALRLYVNEQAEPPLARLATIRGLRNALVFYGRSGDRAQAERYLAEIKKLAATMPDNVDAQERLAASLLGILHYRLAAGVPPVGVAPIVAQLRDLRSRFRRNRRVGTYLKQAEEQSGFQRRRVLKRHRTLIDRALASSEGLQDLYQQIDPSLIQAIARRIAEQQDPTLRERLAALERIVEHFCEAVSRVDRTETKLPESRSQQDRKSPAGHAGVSAYTLANIALIEYVQTRDVTRLDLAVSLLHRALSEDKWDDRTRIHARFLLGQSLVGRFDVTGNFADLEWGLRHLLQVIEATPQDDPERAKRLEFFANSLLKALDRFSATEIRTELGRAHLREAISSLEESVRLTPPGDPALPWRLSSLALALKRRFEASGVVEAMSLTMGRWTPPAVDDLDTARDTLQRAISVASSPKQLEGLYGNLGSILMLRHQVTGDAAALSAAVTAFRHAAAASTADSPSRAHHLQNVARALAHTDADLATVDRAFDEAFRATVDGAGSPLELGDAMSVSPRPGIDFLLERGARAEKLGRWREAAESYAEAQRILDGLVSAQVTRRFQTRQLSESLNIPAKHAYALVRADDAASAIAALERGRARLLSEALTFSQVDPEQLNAAGRPDLGEALSKAVADVRRLEHAALDPASAANLLGGDALRAARQRLQRITSQIHAVPALTSLLTPPTAADIRRLLAGQPVVYLAAADRGGVALIVPSDPDAGVTPVLLDELTDEAVSRYASRFYEANQSRSEDHGRWMHAIDDACEWLWRAAMGPLLVTMRAAEIREFALVACGWLGLLPLHAAWTRDEARPAGRRYAIDEAVISYSPNARALAAARSRAAARHLLDAPLVVTVPEAPGADRLAATRWESEEICRLVPRALFLAAGEATSARVSRTLETCTLAHFACHGRSVPAEPLNSSLLLTDGELKVHALMACRLDKTRLVVLSACETAVPGHVVPEEAVGLPTAFLQAGSAGVVASLWAVPDRVTALLMRMFYRGLVEKNLSPAVALQSAQIRLRDATNGELVASGDIEAPSNLSGAAVRLWQAGRPFSHPYYWAAFSCTGV